MAPVTRDPLLLLFHDDSEVPFSKAVGAACQCMHLVRRTICYVLASNAIFVFKALFVERWRPASRVKIALPTTMAWFTLIAIRAFAGYLGAAIFVYQFTN